MHENKNNSQFIFTYFKIILLSKVECGFFRGEGEVKTPIKVLHTSAQHIWHAPDFILNNNKKYHNFYTSHSKTGIRLQQDPAINGIFYEPCEKNKFSQ